MRRAIPMVLASLVLAACTPDPPPAPMAEIARRAPILPPGSLLIALPGAPAVSRAMTARLTRGGPSICPPAADAMLEPAENGLFRLIMQAPGFLVTRESVLRRTDGPPGGPELALDGANNGRCDYVLGPVATGG